MNLYVNMEHKRKIALLENSQLNFHELHEQLESSPDIKLSIYTVKDRFLESITDNDIDLAVVDILTPGFNNSLLKEAKEKTNAKVVVLTNSEPLSLSSGIVDKEIKKSNTTYKELLKLLELEPG